MDIESKDAQQLSAVTLVDVPNVDAPVKLLAELGTRRPSSAGEGAGYMCMSVTPAESAEIEDDDLVVTPQTLKANPELARPWLVRGRSAPVDVDPWNGDGVPPGTYVRLHLTVADDVSLAGARVDEPEKPEEPLVDPRLWRQRELDHEWRQGKRLKAAWELLTGDERAKTLEWLEKDVLWDRLSLSDQEEALRAIRADREWAGLFERLEAEERQRRKEAAEERQERATRAEAARKAREKAEAKSAKERAAKEKADAERAEREEREAEQERQRRLEEERRRLEGERDELVAS